MTFDIAPFLRVYPFASKFATIGGHRVHYIDEGAGEPIVFVHGNPAWSFCFRELITDLRSDHRVIAMDHVGCGLSDKPGLDAYPYTLQRRIDDLESLLDSINAPRGVTLVVHDWGGMIGLGWALRHVDKVRRIVVMNTAAFLLPAGKRLPFALRIVRNGGPLATLLVQGLNGFTRGAVALGAVTRMPSKVRRGYLAPYDTWRHRIATLQFVRDIPIKPSHRSYAAAKWVDDNLDDLHAKPMMILWGRRDFVFDDAFLDEWRRRFPDADVHTFDDAGHYVMEDAIEAVKPLVRSFVTRQSSRTQPMAEVAP